VPDWDGEATWLADGVGLGVCEKVDVTDGLLDSVGICVGVRDGVTDGVSDGGMGDTTMPLNRSVPVALTTIPAV
jgi:hypothetical protein